MRSRSALPLWGKVLIGVLLGIVVGTLMGKESPLSQPAGAGAVLKGLGDIGMLVIKALRALAVPLVFFAILDAFVKTRIAARSFGRLLIICLINVTVAMTIGLTLLNTLKPGRYWQSNLTQLVAEIAGAYYELLALDNRLDVLRTNIGIQPYCISESWN